MPTHIHGAYYIDQLWIKQKVPFVSDQKILKNGLSKEISNNTALVESNKASFRFYKKSVICVFTFALRSLNFDNTHILKCNLNSNFKM